MMTTAPSLTPTPAVSPRSIEDLMALTGRALGPTRWVEITQERINLFAALTHDQQWIHVDTTRARASSFGSTLAHGLFTLSLGPALIEELIDFSAFAHALNYGYEKVRFPTPLPVGSRVRMRATIVAVDPVTAGQGHVIVEQVFEREHSSKPACVALAVSRCFEPETGEPR